MKLFPNISALEVEEGESGQLIITGLVSKDGERLVLRPPLDTARCQVESWLNQLVPGLHTSLSYSVKSAIHDFGHTSLPQEQWVPNFLGMVSLTALRVWWTARVEDVFDKIKEGSPRAMKEYLEELNQQVENLSEHLNTIEDTIERVKLTSALILNLHFRDVIENLVYNGVTKTDDFLWDSQLRFYWNKTEDTLYVHQCCCKLEFGFDYTGLHESLVSTPQTDRIMLIITQALFMQLGVILSGDSGVGKTETVREMARVLGRLCLVTDCNANMNWRSVGNILSGLAQSGLWGCLEQLDRLDPSTLSVLSSQLQVS